MKRTIILSFVGILFAFSFSPFISSALSAEKIWTTEEIQAGQPGYCVIRPEYKSRISSIFQKFWDAVEKSYGKQDLQKKKERKVSLIELSFEIVSEEYLIVEDKNECPDGWTIHPEQER